MPDCNILDSGLCWPAFSADFRVFPYIQNPTTASMSILWFSNDDTPGRLTYRQKKVPATIRP